MSNVHDDSLSRAISSLEGLSVGDAFGDQFFGDVEGEQFLYSSEYVLSLIAARTLPAPLWKFTDDTNMALSVFSSLKHHQKIDQDWLAQSFAQRFDLHRKYGVGMYRLLKQVGAGKHWSSEAKTLFYGEGSYGNGAAMRVAPLGAYFADDFYLVVEQAKLSAEVTHAHPEGIAGAIAIAVAAALAWQMRKNGKLLTAPEFLDQILSFVPNSEVKTGISRARDLSPTTSVVEAVAALGNGLAVSAQDTVPFALWCAAQHLDNYEEALWLTVSGLGDRDTTCAMVGGIVASYTGLDGIPSEWRSRREPLPEWSFE